MPRNSQRGSKNNNPQGHNQYSNGMMDMARERPVVTAAAAAAAVGAGVFLWSRRSQISDQLTNLSEQIGEWTNNMASERELEVAGGSSQFSGSASSGSIGQPTGTASTAGTTRGSASRSSRPSGGGRRNASSGSGTMSGGSLDTGPSGRGQD
jgi:hypothetical protein